MTFSELLERESKNVDSIFLYKEGIFLKAYERSAYWLYMLVNDFKLSKRYIKVVDQEVISLGFPEKSIKKWLNRFEYKYLNQTTVCCKVGRTLDVEKYLIWKDSIETNKDKSFTPHTAFIQKTPLFKVAYDTLIQIYEISRNFSGDTKATLGKDMKEKAFSMCYIIRCVFDTEMKADLLLKVLAYCNELKFIGQVLKDLNQISLNQFSLLSERLVSVSKQTEAMKRKYETQ